VWEASAKHRALQLRQEELDFHVSRYTAAITQTTLLAGFAFESLVHLETEHAQPAMAFLFNVGLSLTIMSALYVVLCASILVICSQQVGLLGAEGKSLEDAIDSLRKWRTPIYGAAFMSLACFIVAGIAIAWIKMEGVAILVTQMWVVFAVILFLSIGWIVKDIGSRKLVDGHTRFVTPECVCLPSPRPLCQRVRRA
jgi:hypothetical protein